MHFSLISELLFCILEVRDSPLKTNNLINQLEIQNHDGAVLLLVNLMLLLLSLLKSGQRGLEVLSLIVHLLFDVSIDINRLGVLLLNPWVKVLVHHLLELLKVIDVLGTPIDSVFEGSDLDIVVSDLGPVLGDGLHHVGLPLLQVINHETKIGVQRVELHKLLIHILGLSLQ